MRATRTERGAARVLDGERMTRAALLALVGLCATAATLVALLVGLFTLHAAPLYPASALIVPEGVNRIPEINVDPETLQVTAAPVVLVYDKNFDLILSTNPSSISTYEKEHLDRLLNICDLLVIDDETTIYWLDK